jgi:hypothetical protein
MALEEVDLVHGAIDCAITREMKRVSTPAQTYAKAYAKALCRPG